MSAKTAVASVSFLFSDIAFGYIGPGMGLGTLGVVLGVVVSIFLALVAVVWYPIKRIFRKSSKRTDDDRSNEEDDKSGNEESYPKDKGDD